MASAWSAAGYRVERVKEKRAEKRVLVIEDDREIRQLLWLHLRNADYRVVAAEDAIEGGRKLIEEAGAIDLIIVDAQLPYLSGIDFASAVIADTSLPTLPIILITGHHHLAPKAERLGVPCLVKPFTADQLLAVVGQALTQSPPIPLDAAA